jgi:photosystem II stability/assembly factor-like uncharacterized protein
MKRIAFFLFVLALFQFKEGECQFNLQIVDTSNFILASENISVNYRNLSFRGMHVVNDKVVWVSGSQSVVAKSIDGGKSFSIMQIPDYPNLQLRSIYAFSKDVAIVVASGSPAYIFKTIDGGKSWKKVFQNDAPEIFLDAIDFWDINKGAVIGDPIDERFVLYKTNDAGNTWYPFDTAMRPWAIPGESLFAASGTSFKCLPKGSLGFVTGGSVSVFHWLQMGKFYQRYELKSMKSGSPSKGAFSFDINKNYIAIVGGDFESDTAKTKQSLYYYEYRDEGLELLNSKPFYTGYRSCVTFIGDKPEFITCGPTGVESNHTESIEVNPSKGKGKISEKSFNVIRTDKSGKLIVLAGSQGKIAVLTK